MNPLTKNISKTQQLSLAVSLGAAVLFGMGLIGFVFDFIPLAKFMEAWRPIKPVTCLAGLTLSVGNMVTIFYPKERIPQLAFGLVPAILALMCFTAHFSGEGESVLDRVFSIFGQAAINHPGQMSLTSSFLIVFAAIAYMAEPGNKKTLYVSQFVSLLIGLCSLFIVLGHFFQSKAIVSNLGMFTISMHAGIGLTLLSLALLLRERDNGIIHFYTRKSVSITASLWILIINVSTIVMLSWIRYQAEANGFIDSRLGLTIMTTLIVALIFVVVTVSAKKLNRVEQLNKGLVERLDSHKTELENILTRTSDGVIVIDRKLIVKYINPNVATAANKEYSEIIGFHILKLFYIVDLYESYREQIELAFETGKQSKFITNSKEYDLWFENHLFPADETVTIFYRNITVQKKAEQELLKAKLSYQSLVENMNDLVIRVSDKGELLYISPEKPTLRDSLRQQLVSRMCVELRKKPYHDSADYALQTMDPNETKEIEVILQAGDDQRIFEVRCSPEYDDQQHLVSVLGICREMTDQHVINERNNRLTSILENTTAMVAQADSSFRSTYINPAGRLMLGIDMNTPLPLIHISNYTTPEAKEFMQTVAFPHALEHGTWMGRSELKRSNGHVFPVMVILIVHKDLSGNFSYVSSVTYDLSEVSAQQNALHESEQRWQFAVDGSNLGLWDWDIQNNKIFYSNRYTEMLGYTVEEFGNDIEAWSSRIHPDDFQLAHKELEDYFKGLKPEYDLIHRVQKKDGDYIYIRDRGRITEYNADGSPKRMIGTHSDVTKSIEQISLLNKAKEELRSLAIHLQDIREEERLNLSRMIHEEFGQQLSSLKMDLSSIDMPPEASSKENRQKLSKAMRTLETTIQVVKKLSSDLRPSIIEDLGLVASLQTLTQEFQVRFDIRIRFSSLLDHIETSGKTALCFYRVYQEALSNIARHSLASKVAVRLTISEDGLLILAIKDDGVGFDVSDRSFSSNFGLVEVRERMLMINGQMEINSAPGCGTLLLVKAPMSLEE